MLRFSLALSSLAIAILAVLSVGEKFGWLVTPSFSRSIVLFLWLTHLVMYGTVVRQLKLRPADFVKLYLGLTVLRILFFGVFIFLLIRIDRSEAYQNALLFLVSYFLFTALEVAALYRVVSPHRPLKEGQKEG